MGQAALPWSVRTYQKGDEHEIRGLFRHVFGKELSLERWNWLYRDNPHGLRAFTLAEDANGRLVGQYAVMPVRMQIGRTECLGSLALDTMVHPDFRGQGMFTRLGRTLYRHLAREGVWLTYGFPNANSYHGSIHKLGWHELTDGVPVFARVLNPEAVLGSRIQNQLLVRALSPLARAGLGFVRVRRRVETPSRYRISRVTAFDERADFLWDRASGRYAISVIRDREYLNWRYVENPTEVYEFFVAETDRGVAGYIVLKDSRQFGVRIGYIVDLLTLPGSPPAAELLSFAVRHFSYKQVDIISCLMVEHTVYARLLRTLGFLLIPRWLMPRELYFGACRHAEELHEAVLFDANNWYLTWGDHDVI